MSTATPRIKRYYTLHAIRTLYKVLAILMVVLWLVVIVVTALSAVNVSAALSALILPSIQLAVVAFGFYAVSQVIDAVLSINENQRQLSIQNRTLLRGVKRMLDRMDDLEKRQMELHERQHRILKVVDRQD